MRIVDLLHTHNDEKQAAHVIETGFSITYHKLREQVRLLAEKLFRLGCRPGVKIGLYLDNSIEYLIGLFSVSGTGGTIVPLSVQMTAHEMNNTIQSGDISILITGDKEYSKLNEINPSITCILISYLKDRLVLEVKQVGQIIVNESTADIAMMIATSGTTGAVKYAMLTDYQLLSNMYAFRDRMQFNESHRAYCVLPFYHIYSISAQILTHISLGDTLYISNGPFFIKDFIRVVRSYKITVSAFVPYMAIMMAQNPDVGDMRSLQSVFLAGGGTPGHIISILTQKYPHINFVNTYGLTEAGPRVTVGGSHFPPASAGTPLKDISLKIAQDGTEDGSVGEIWVKSSGIMKGYYKQPQLTAEVISDGWLKTGDIGRLDEQGNLYIVGRKKELIISGGRNIYPNEIEECLLKHPVILEAVVVAKEHLTFGEVPYAFIVTQDNKDIQSAELVAYCKNYLSGYKIPHYFHRVDTIPKLNATKVNRKLLMNNRR